MSAALCFRPDGSEASWCSACNRGPTTRCRSWISSSNSTAISTATRSPSSGTDFRPTAAKPCRPSSKSQRTWLVVERLPAYAPDLNPVEQVWGNLKGGELANLCPDTIDEAEEIVDQGLCRIGNDTRLAFSFLRHCGLEL